jgi:stress response protein SCP2
MSLKISNRVLIQAYNHFLNRDKLRLVIPKGKLSSSRVLPALKPELNIDVACELKSKLDSQIPKSQEEVYIDPILKNIPVPTSMRSFSEGIMNLSRGSKIEMDTLNKNVLRYFIWWTSSTDNAHSDLDLSSVMLDQDFKYISHIAYTNLKNSYAIHSGDITSVKDKYEGSCEFIDIDLSKLEKNVRYLTLDVRRYGGDIVGAKIGWMMRDGLNSNKSHQFDPKTVQNCIAMSDQVGNLLVCLFDIRENKIIWLDMDMVINQLKPNSLVDNIASSTQIVEYFVHSKYYSVYDLLTAKYSKINENAKLRIGLEILDNFGEIVKSIE